MLNKEFAAKNLFAAKIWPPDTPSQVITAWIKEQSERLDREKARAAENRWRSKRSLAG